jgi:alkylated DNA repair dioxygenase AlkB
MAKKIMSQDLFGSGPEQGISFSDEDLDITYWPGYLSESEADNFLSTLLNETDWMQPELWMYGRLVKTPRMTAWYGDENATYKYSGIVNKPLAWTSTLLQIKNLVESTTQQQYNSVLLNLYRDGADYLSWHSDNETELGTEPTIASLSLGASRTFSLRARMPTSQKKKYDFQLVHGSLLCMRGRTQSFWEHTIKKEMKVITPRVNLTFRKVSPLLAKGGLSPSNQILD